MITPEQRQAWKEEYLGELRKIAQTPETVDVDIQDEDNGTFEPYFIRFYCQVFSPLLNTFNYAINNHPLIAAEIDTPEFKQESKATISEVFHFLQPLSPYGQDEVISSFKCDSSRQELLMTALQNDDETSFTLLVHPLEGELSDVFLRIGHLCKAQTIVQNVDECISNNDTIDIPDIIKQQGIEEYGKDIISFYLSHDDILEKVKALSLFDIGSKEDVVQRLYCYSLKVWHIVIAVSNAVLLDEELSIIKGLLNTESFSDVVVDFRRLNYMLFDAQPDRIYSIENKAQLDVLMGLVK